MRRREFMAASSAVALIGMIAPATQPLLTYDLIESGDRQLLQVKGEPSVLRRLHARYIDLILDGYSPDWRLVLAEGSQRLAEQAAASGALLYDTSQVYCKRRCNHEYVIDAIKEINITGGVSIVALREQ